MLLLKLCSTLCEHDFRILYVYLYVYLYIYRHIHTKLGGNWLVRFFYNCFGMLAYSISEPIYIGLRRLFIERFDIDQEFDFHSFMVESVEEEYANILSMELASWILVIVSVFLFCFAHCRIRE